MNEWIDFFVYATQAVVLWILMPRWSTRMALPLLRARNSAWVDAHPGALAQAQPGAWFLKACYAWAAVSIAVLLAVRLGPQTQGWKALMSTSNLLLAIGLVGYFSGGAVFMRWVAKTVPQSERRQATLRPRSTGDYAPRWLRLVVYVAVGAHVLTWAYAGISGKSSDPRYWWAFTGIMGMTVLVSVLGQYTVLRRPGWMDSDPGTNYRRAEIRMMYALQLCLVGFGAVALSKLVLNLDLQRICTLGFALFLAASILVLTRPRVPTDNLLIVSRGT